MTDNSNRLMFIPSLNTDTSNVSNPLDTPSFINSVYITNDNTCIPDQCYPPHIPSTIQETSNPNHLYSTSDVFSPTPTSQSHLLLHSNVMTPYTPEHKSLMVYNNDGMSRNYTPMDTPIRAEKNNKGLRHFSMKVLQKVQAKKVTSYNEVADELVREFGNTSADPEKQSYEQKNIRRRVYDALNVLMAMNIIHKEKKEIKWVGLPSNEVQDSQRAEETQRKLLVRVHDKIKRLREMIIQQVCIQRLINENETRQLHQEQNDEQHKIDLPFAALITSNQNNIECTVNPSKDDYLFHFETNFDVLDETQILKQMGYAGSLEHGHCSLEELNLYKSNLPPTVHPFLDIMATCLPQDFSNFILNLRTHLSMEINPDPNVAQEVFIGHLMDAVIKARFVQQTGNDLKINCEHVPDLEDNEQMRN